MQTVMSFVNGEGKGIITAAESRKLGCSPSVTQRLLRAKQLVRITRGAFVSAAALNPPKDHPAARDAFALAEHQHLLRLDAVLRLYDKAAAASHQSAVLAWGLPVEVSSLNQVHVVHTSRGRTARRFDAFSLHTCELDDVITRHKDRRLVLPTLAVIGQALEVGLLAGVAAMDAGMVAKRMTRAELVDMLTRLRSWPRVGIARRALELADGLAESPGETRLRLALIELGVAFVAQHWVRTGDGLHYRVDFYLPGLGVVLEYDGRGKYSSTAHGTGARSGQARADTSSPQALIDEKKREDDLRLEGFGVGRVTLQDLTAKRLSAIVKKAMQQARPGARHRKAEPPTWATS